MAPVITEDELPPIEDYLKDEGPSYDKIPDSESKGVQDDDDSEYDFDDYSDEKSKAGDPDDFSDMEPTDPMEEDGFMDEQSDNQMPDFNSFMRPHVGPKVDYWANVEKLLQEEKAEFLHRDPDVIHLENFLTTAECMQLVQLHEKVFSEREDPPNWCFADEGWLKGMLAEEQLTNKANIFTITDSMRFERSCVKGADVHNRLTQKLPYSGSTWVPRGENKLVDQIEWRLEEDYGLPRDYAYHSQFIKYRNGQQYKHHFDCSAEAQSQGAENDRLATVIIYLSDVKEGGETDFPELKLKVKPKRGSALIFKNLDKKGRCDLRTLHSGESPKSGVKYIYQHWYHQRIILPSYTQDYVLCDNTFSCREYVHSNATRTATKLMKSGEAARPNIKKAVEFYKQAVLAQPNHGIALLFAGDSMAQLQKSVEALGFFERHLKLHPKSIDANFIAASLLQDKGDVGKAITLLKRVLSVSPKDTDALYNIATLYAQGKRAKEAASALKSLVQVNPKDGDAHAFLAEVLQGLGDKEGAKKHMKEAKKNRSRSRS